MKKLIKRVFNTFGLDICRISKTGQNRFGWLRDLNINTVFDIGANTGQFVMVMKDLLPEAIFHYFEPISSDYQKLVNNTEKLHKVKTYNMALGDFNSKSIIYHHEFSPAISLLKATKLALSNYPYIGGSIEEEILVQKLDDIILSCGINLRLLRNTSQICLQLCQIILVKWHNLL
jgi:FkbM family methyltransferase